jgi:hypothetical protein
LRVILDLEKSEPFCIYVNKSPKIIVSTLSVYIVNQFVLLSKQV